MVTPDVSRGIDTLRVNAGVPFDGTLPPCLHALFKVQNLENVNGKNNITQNCSECNARLSCGMGWGSYHSGAIKVPQTLRSIDIVRQVALQHAGGGGGVAAVHTDTRLFDADGEAFGGARRKQWQ